MLAGLLAAVSLLRKTKNFLAAVTAVSVLGALLLIEDTIDASDRGAGLWIAVTAGVVQAGVATAALLLDAGVITAPAPRPKYDQYYGQYGGYYGRSSRPPTSSPAMARSTAGTRPARTPVASLPNRSAAEFSPVPARIAHPANGFPQLQPAAVVRFRRVGPGKRRRPGRISPQPTLLRLGSAAAGAVLAVGPVTVLTVRCGR